MDKTIEFWLTEEIAKRLRVTRQTVTKLIRDGALPAVRVGQGWRVPGEAVEEFCKPKIAKRRNGGGR